MRGLTVVILSILIALIPSSTILAKDVEDDQGRIAVLYENRDITELYIVEIERFSNAIFEDLKPIDHNDLDIKDGPTAFSQDGKLIAGICETDLICIYEISSNNQGMYELGSIAKKSFPSMCQEVIAGNGLLKSISWSPDGKKMAIACSTSYVEEPILATICILELQNDNDICWDGVIKTQKQSYGTHSSDVAISNVKWAPNNSGLLVSDAIPHLGRTYFVNIDGTGLSFINWGNHPFWSLGGDEVGVIASPYVHQVWDEDGSVLLSDESHSIYDKGFLINDFHSREEHWIYVQPSLEFSNSTSLNREKVEFLCGYRGGTMGLHPVRSMCTIEWIQNGKAIVFEAWKHYVSGIDRNEIFIFDIQKRNVKCVSCNIPNGIGSHGNFRGKFILLDWFP